MYTNDINYLVECLIRIIWVCSKCCCIVGKTDRELVQQVCQINSPNAAKVVTIRLMLSCSKSSSCSIWGSCPRYTPNAAFTKIVSSIHKHSSFFPQKKIAYDTSKQSASQQKYNVCDQCKGQTINTLTFKFTD